MFVLSFYTFFFFKQKTAYEMRISDWSSDVCSSDLVPRHVPGRSAGRRLQTLWPRSEARPPLGEARHGRSAAPHRRHRKGGRHWPYRLFARQPSRSEEHTSELQSLMRISYAVFSLTKKNKKDIHNK